jgi:integrase
MSVRKRSWVTRRGEAKEAWVVDYTAGSRRHVKTFSRKKDADAFAATVHVDIRAGIHTSPNKVTVAEAGAKWLADCEGRLEPSTVEAYQQHLNDHIVPYLGTVKLSLLTVPMVRDFMDILRRNGRSPAMIKRVVNDLGSILTDAQERGLVAQNVVRSLRQRRRRHSAELRHQARLVVGEHIPVPEEIRAIVAHLQGRWRPLLLTAIFTGLRASELRGLKWNDVDFDRHVLHVRQRADKYKTIGKPKSVAGQRTLPMPPILTSVLREWKLACPKGELGLVFPTGAGNVEDHANIITRGLMPVQIAAGVVTKDGKAKYTGLHALRHFYASWCINRKADGGLELPLKVVQHRLGHATINMTADVYGHLFPNRDDGAELAAAQKALLG